MDGDLCRIECQVSIGLRTIKGSLGNLREVLRDLETEHVAVSCRDSHGKMADYGALAMVQTGNAGEMPKENNGNSFR